MSSDGWKKGLLAAGWNLRKALELATYVEEMGTDLYRRLAKHWESEPTLRDLFAKLALDEVAHREVFQTLLSTVRIRRSDPVSLDVECLRTIAQTSFFSAGSGALRGIEDSVTEAEVLGKVFKFEKATLLYYLGLRDVLGASTALDRIVAEEKRHTVYVMHACASLEAAPATP
jgi:rubrerythrin